MKKILWTLSILLNIGVIVFVAGGLYAVTAYKGRGPLAEPKIVLIERGTGIGGIADALHAEGAIKSPLVFKIFAALNRGDGTLKAGEYEIMARASMASVMDMIRDGRVYDRRITVPEGMTVNQIISAINAIDVLTGEVGELPEEGTLLPETYHYTKGDTRASVIAQMRAAMDKTMADLWEKRASDLPFTTQKEALTLASIVEKETGVPSERARIAGVFVNRLRQGIPLQSDPTVIYGMTMGKVEDKGQGPIGRRLLTKDLAVDSPYNTYKNVGLPPAPIASPGRAAIEAVLNPEKNDYIFFVADGTGGHVFATTLSEHNRNVAKWRRIRKEQEQ